MAYDVGKKKIYFGSDHAGFVLKEKLEEYVRDLGYDAIDLGNTVFDPDDDYPDFIFPVAERVARERSSLGIVLGGSGQGEAIAANKHWGIRCAIGYSVYGARMSRDHNDSNILSLGARTISESEAKEIVKAWLEAPFSADERHKRRIEKIESFEGKKKDDHAHF